MALAKLVADLNIHQGKPDKVRGQATATKEYFDKAPNDIKDFINGTLTVEVDTLNTQNVKLTGAQSIADVKTFTSSPIVPTPTTDMQTSTKKYVDDMGTSKTNDLTTHKSSADHDGRYYTETEIDTKISTLNGIDTTNANNLTTHKSSADHDGRYYTETEIDVSLNLKADDNAVVHLALDETVSGTKTFSKSPVAPTPTSSGQVSTKGYVDTVLADAVLGAIPDNSLTNSKLAPEIKISSLYTATNAGNNYSITPNPAISAYSDGITLKVKVNADSTGSATLNVNSLGIKNILKANGVNATSLKANGVYTVVYSSGNFILQGEGASGNAIASDLLSGKTASTDAGDITGAMSNNGAVAIIPGISNQAIPAGYHNGSGYVAGDADLVTGNIRAGVDIFGVAGKASVVDTADATINDGSWMLTPATAYKNGVKIIGNMPNRGAVVLTPTTSNQVISNGYHSGSGYVVGDADLVSSNILNTANIFGVQGSVMAGKRYISGTVTTSNTPSNYQYAGSTSTRGAYSATVSGLSFTPSYIILSCYVSPYAPTYEYTTVYRNNGGGYAKVANAAQFCVGSATTGSNTYAYKADVSPAYVNSSGFSLPCDANNALYSWIAIE